MENVKICEILIKVRTNESLATNMQKANDDGPILQIYKLKSRKKPSLYYTHDIFSSLDDTFCASTQNCPLWVTNSVRKKFVILVLSPLLPVDKSSGERDIQKMMCLFLQYARHMIYVKERIGMIPGIYIFCPTERGHNDGGGVNINAIPDSRPSLQSPALGLILIVWHHTAEGGM